MFLNVDNDADSGGGSPPTPTNPPAPASEDTTMQTLTELVADRLGPGRPLTYDKFEEQAIDERTGYRPSRGVLWKVAHGKKVHIDPPLIRAIAAGLRIPEAQVQAAAAYQFLGLVVTQTAEGIALTMPGTKDPDTDAVLRQAERARNEGEDDSN